MGEARSREATTPCEKYWSNSNSSYLQSGWRNSTFDCSTTGSSVMTKRKAWVRWLEFWRFFQMAATVGGLWAWLRISFRRASSALSTVWSGNFGANISTNIKHVSQDLSNEPRAWERTVSVTVAVPRN